MNKLLHIFRDDLRLADNPALSYAAEHGALTCLYILEEGERQLGGASLWWLHHSLTLLKERLEAFGVQLIFKQGKAQDIVAALVEAHGFTCVTWNRRYTASGIAIDTALKASLTCEVKSFNGNLLREPFDVKPYKVFTPYWRTHQVGGYRAALAVPAFQGAALLESDDLASWELLPTKPNWAIGFDFEVGEQAAATRLEGFIADGLKGYAEGRNNPDRHHFSRLSPYLRFGEISPVQIFQRLSFEEPSQDISKFQAELGWREFSYHLLYHYPDLAWKNFNEKFDGFEYAQDNTALKAWQLGQTGYPIVDAGMRELWQTGFMHNRVRMVVASFLIKHLLIDWRLGEQWFWDCLLDADPANNAASWQWVAGTGADAAPYYRIFNPILQGDKFDPNGDYVKKFVPELAHMPAAFIHKPFDAPLLVLRAAGVTLGGNYPKPLVEHGFARERALNALSTLRG